jgi:hypothetical protein
MASVICFAFGFMMLISSISFAGDSPSYVHDESKNSKGPNQCSNDNDCDGMRKCSSAGYCQGIARKPGDANCKKGPDFHTDEGPRGNRCQNECDCDGNRTCSDAGWCQGTAR